jgi:hypothetical protein
LWGEERSRRRPQRARAAVSGHARGQRDDFGVPDWDGSGKGLFSID